MTNNESRDALDAAIEVLIKGIREYECEFWSSSEEGVTEQEARDAAARIIYQTLFDKEGYPEKIDGAVVESSILAVRANGLKKYKLNDVDIDYCRIYYYIKNADGDGVTYNYCLQDDTNSINFYDCTDEGEPLNKIELVQASIQLPVPKNPSNNNWVQKMINWIESH